MLYTNYFLCIRLLAKKDKKEFSINNTSKFGFLDFVSCHKSFTQISLITTAIQYIHSEND